MVRDISSPTASPPVSNPSLLSLSNASPNVSVIPPNLHEAFSLAGVYGENAALNSYANLAAWQTPWYNNSFFSAARAFNNLNGAPNSNGHENHGPRGEPIGNENQSPLNSNSNRTITPNLPLPPQLFGPYNNYLAPSFGPMLASNNSTPSPVTTSVPHSNTNGMQMSTISSSANPSPNVLRNLNVPVDNGRPMPPTNTNGRPMPNININGRTLPPSNTNGRTLLNTNNNNSTGPTRVRHSARGGRSSGPARHCECPNCMSLASRGLTIDRRNEKHTCHVPGCMKVYGKSSHLKAHLRWHNTARPAVNKRTVKPTNGAQSMNKTGEMAS